MAQIKFWSYFVTTVRATGCCTYMCVNCLQYGRLPWKIHAKKLACKFLSELLHIDFLHANLSVFLRWLILLMTINAICVYFFTTTNVADVKLETNIVEKHLFAVKEKTTYYTLSLSMIMLRSWTSCFVINNFLGCWQKHYFTCKLGCMLLYLPWLLFWNNFNVLACIAGARTSVHCFVFFFSDLFMLNRHIKHVSLRVYFYTSVSRVFFSWNLHAIWQISTHETRV